MKKFKSLLIIVFSAFLAVSCQDALDITQDGEIDNAASFKTVNNLRQFLIGSVYNRVNNTNEIEFSAIFTDEVGIGKSSGGQGLELHRYIFNANDGYASSLWLSQYTLINRINRLIEVSDLVVTTTPADEAAKQSVIAEARAIRAYAYLQLQAFYSTNMADNDALGVLLLDFVPAIDTKLPRVKNSEIYALMEADLNFAQDNLASTNVNYKYVTRGMIDAVRSRMYLYRGLFDLAKQYAQSAITNSGLSLATAATYGGSTSSAAGMMWNDLERGEIIFAASRPSAGTWSNIGGIFTFNLSENNGGIFHDMGRNLFNQLNGSTGDIRRNRFVDVSSAINTNYLTAADYLISDNIVIDKYPGKTSQPLRNDLKLFRVSELVLIIAECEARKASPDLAAAAQRVKSIRDARFTVSQVLPVYANAQQALTDILLERRKELCFEGHRYLDLKRLGALTNKSIDRNITDDSVPNTPLTLPIDDFRFTFPIPQNEIAGNLTIVQNPGYSN